MSKPEVWPVGRTVSLDLSGLCVRLDGVPASLARDLRARWLRFRPVEAHEPATPFLRVQVGVGGAPHTEGGTMGRRMDMALDRHRARFEADEGVVEVALDGAATMLVAPGDPGRQHWGLVNLLMAALGWLLPNRGGALLHAAGVVVADRGFVLIGPEGAGKTTWAREAERGGARVLSDDVVLVDGRGAVVEVVSAPFRANDFQPVGKGRWPLAAILLAEHGPPRLRSVPRLTLEGRLAANLLYLTDAVVSDPRVGRVLDRLLDSVPARTLTFAPEPSFVPLLARFAAED